MKIDSVKISENLTNVTIRISDAANANRLYFWNDKNYKDYTKALNLSTKLSGVANEVIIINLNDLNESYFDGIYFFEVEDNTTTSMGYDYSLKRYEECIIDKVIKMGGCDTCLDDRDRSVINSHSLLMSLEYALGNRFVDQEATTKNK